MSLEALPTELDLRIIGFLDTKHKSALSRVSKYYRDVAEPLLYERVQLWGHDDHRVRQLLLTLLQRKDLRHLVKEFCLWHSRSAPIPLLPRLDKVPISPDGYHLNELFWSHITEIKAAWFAEVFELCPLFDGSLSLLLCLLPKIKHLHLELTSEHRLPMTLELLAGLTLQDSSDIDTERSFGQIENLTVKSVSGPACVFPITLRAGMKEVHIDGNRDFCLHGGINPARLNYDSLRSMSLRSTDVHPGVLEEAIQSSILRNLETLIVDGVGRCDLGSYKRRSWLGFDYRKLKQVMLQNSPKLRCFGWTGMAYRTGWNDRLEPFGSFAGFPYLDSLYIDYKLLFDVVEDQPQNELPDLCLLPFMLPPKLRQFRIYGITWAVVQEIYTAYLEASDTGSGALDEFLRLMSRLPLKVVALTIDMSSWPHDHQMADWQEFAIDEPAIHLLRSISDSWMKVGVDFWAEYRMVEWHERPRALVYSGFTASSVMYDGYEATLDKRGNRRLEEARAEANVEELSDGESEVAGDEVDGDEARGEESEVAGDEVDKSQESEVAAGNL